MGTSAAAITATLLAAGYDTQEMLDALSERESDKPVFAGFLGDPAPFDQAAIDNSTIRSLLRNIDFTFLPQGIEERLGDQLTNTLIVPRST